MARVMMNNIGLYDVNPLTCGLEKCPPLHTWGPASREFYLLHYVYSGRGEFHTARGSYAVESGQIFVIRPQELVSYSADAAEPWTYGWVGFACRFSLDEVLRSDVFQAPECVHLFRAMSDATRLDSAREWYICGKIYELLSLLAAASAPRQNDAAHYVRMAQNYIESQYVEPIRIEQIARYLNLNRSYFSKIFRIHTGKSPQEYLVNFRLQKAAELISTQGLAPGEAARMVGYGDALNFSRMFRKRYGVSPSRYRNRQKPESS